MTIKRAFFLLLSFATLLVLAITIGQPEKTFFKTTRFSEKSLENLPSECSLYDFAGTEDAISELSHVIYQEYRQLNSFLKVKLPQNSYEPFKKRFRRAGRIYLLNKDIASQIPQQAYACSGSSGCELFPLNDSWDELKRNFNKLKKLLRKTLLEFKYNSQVHFRVRKTWIKSKSIYRQAVLHLSRQPSYYSLCAEVEVTPTPMSSPVESPTLRPSPSLIPTPTLRPSPTPSSSVMPSPTLRPSPAPSPSPTPTLTPTPSPMPSPTLVPSPSASPTPTFIPMPSPDMGIGISETGHYFKYKNKPLMMLGESGTQVAMIDNNINIDTWIDQLKSEGHTGIMVWSFLGMRKQSDIDRFGYELKNYGFGGAGLTPWKSVANYKYGLFEWNEQYWKRYRQLCTKLKDNGMILGYTVFFGWPKDDLENHPFHYKAGGIASTRQQITSFIDGNTFPNISAHPYNFGWSMNHQIQWHWENFANKLISESASCDNIWFDFRDEWSYDDEGAVLVQNYFRNYFQARGKMWGDISRQGSVFSRNQSNDAQPEHFYQQPFLPALTTEQPPYASDPTGAMDNAWWDHAINGLHFAYHNDQELPGIMAWDPNTQAIRKTNPYNDTARKYIGYAGRFFSAHVIDLDGLMPNHGLVTSGTARIMANPLREYVVYVKSSSVGINLTQLQGPARYQIYNPRTGQMMLGPTYLAAGGIGNFNRPNGATEWVILIQSQRLVNQHASNSKSCNMNWSNILWTGKHDQRAFYNQWQSDSRMLCWNGRINECGWELSDKTFASKATNGKIIGNWQCDLNNKIWQPINGKVSDQSCTANFINVWLDGQNNQLGYGLDGGGNTGDSRFLCMNRRFYECGWEITNNSYVAAKATNSQVVGNWQCDLPNKTWRAK